MALKHNCGVGGVYNAPNTRALLRGLHTISLTLQRRGDESAGVAFYHGGVDAVTAYGDAANLYTNILPSFQTHATTGMCHNRYSTCGDSTLDNAQPFRRYVKGKGAVVVGHNGTILNPNYVMEKHGYERYSSSDSEALAWLLADSYTFEEGADKCCTELIGAFNFVAINSKGELAAFRDPNGFHPLVTAEVGDTFYVASEDIALIALGIYDGISEVKPGELIVVSDSGIIKKSIRDPTPTVCSFERTYFMNHGSTCGGVLNSESREELGRRLSIKYPSKANIIVPVMDSGCSFAVGASNASGKPYKEVMIRNHLGRTYTAPDGKKSGSQGLVSLSRFEKALLKNVPIPSLIRGTSIELYDDSIIRLNVARAVTQNLLRAGAKEIHLRLGIPPVRFPCFWGMDHATRNELAAARYEDTEVAGDFLAKELGIASVRYIPLGEYKEVIGNGHCYACHDGKFPTEVPDAEPFISALRLD